MMNDVINIDTLTLPSRNQKKKRSWRKRNERNGKKRKNEEG